MSELITTKTEYGEFGISLNPLNYVVQANDLIEAMPNLSLNATKLLRIMIMQIKPDDEEFFKQVFSINDLSQILDISSSNLYRDIGKITNELRQSSVSFETTGRGVYLNLASACCYDGKRGIGFKFNDDMKPLLLNLQKTYNYTQYRLEKILKMQSAYSIRLYEILCSKIMTNAKKTVHVKISVDSLRRTFDCTKKLKQFGQFKKCSKTIKKCFLGLKNLVKSRLHEPLKYIKYIKYIPMLYIYLRARVREAKKVLVLNC